MTTTAIGVKTRIADVLNIPADRVSEEISLKDLVSDSFLLVEMAIAGGFSGSVFAGGSESCTYSSRFDRADRNQT